MFSESLYNYNKGFYNSISDDEVKKVEDLFQDITSGIDSINGSRLNINLNTEISHEALKLDLISLVNTLNYFDNLYRKFSG